MKKLLSFSGQAAGNFRNQQTSSRTKRALAIFTLFLFSSVYSFAQSRFVQVPATVTGTSGASRAPNGSVDFQRTSIIYLGSEMPAVPATNITSIGFSIATPAATVATGNIKLYMVNTSDGNNTRGNNWANILTTPSPMTLVYDGPLTIPTTAGFYNITLQTPFAYTGGNFYLAYEWSATTKSAASAVYNANTAIAGTPILTGTGTTLPATLSLTSTFRPVLRIGFVPLPNDLAVAQVYSLGKLPNLTVVNPHVVRAAIVNTGSTTKTNVTVSLAVTGANTFNTTTTIASLPGGDTTVVTFPGYTATTAGTNNLVVSVPTDDNVNNNTANFSQLVTTNEISYAEGLTPLHTTALRPTGTNGTLLAKFNVNGPIFLPSVNMMVSFYADNVGKTIYAVVLNSSGTLIGRSPNHVVVTGDLSTMKNFVLSTPGGAPVSLTAGDYYIGMAAVADPTPYFPLGAQAEDPVRPNTFYTSPIGGGTPTLLNSNTRLIIEPVLSTCLNPATPTVTPTGNAVICAGNSVTLTGSSTTPGVTYQWFRNGIAITGATSTTTTVNTVGNYTLVATTGACTSAPSAVVNVTINTPVTPTITAGGPTAFCQNSGVVLTGASTASNLTYQWNRDGVVIPGATAISLTVNTSGDYTFTTTNSSGCSAVSSDITVTVTPMPPVPTITQNGGTLTSSAATGNQWYRNSFAIAGATGQTLVTTQNGAYTVEVTDNGCKSGQSNLVNVNNTGLSDALAGMSVQVYPNPASGSFTVKLTGYDKDATVALYSLTGQLLLSENVKATASGKNFDAKGLAAGTYVLKVTSPKGVQVSRLVIE